MRAERAFGASLIAILLSRRNARQGYFATSVPCAPDASPLPFPVRKILSLVSIGALAFGGWKYIQTQQGSAFEDLTVSYLAPLVDYREVYDSGKSREANDLLLKTMAVLVRSDDEGLCVVRVLDRCAEVNNTPPNYADLLTESLQRNLKICRGLGLDTVRNVMRMKDGKSPVVMKGPYEGEPAEVDHIVPRSLAPDLDNLLINLELMPRTLNRRKSDKVTERGLATAKKFFEAGVMRPESWEAVRKAVE